MNYRSLGTMGMSDMYGPADRGESIATVRAVLVHLGILGRR